MTEKRSFKVPQSTAMAGKEGWADKGEGRVNMLQRLKTGKPVIVRFMSDPLDESRDEDADWVFYREVGAWDGLLGGITMPGGLMEFPVFDVQYFEDGTRASAPRGSDLLFDAVLPSQREKGKGFNRAQASDQMAFNAIVVDGDFGGKKPEFNPKPGQHVLIKLSGQKGRQLLEQLSNKAEEAAEEGKSFNPLRGAWTISLVGTPPQTDLMLTRKLKGVPELDEAIESVHVMEYLEAIREDAEAAWQNATTGAVASEELGDGDEDEDDLVDEFEEGVAEATATPEVDYSVMSPARLKKLLTDAEVEFPARATTAKLIELAQANL